MTEDTQKSAQEMVSIWTWVGLVLFVYGLIIPGAGIYYIFEPESVTATASYNPSLWWGIIMLVAAAIFLATSLLPRLKK